MFTYHAELHRRWRRRHHTIIRSKVLWSYEQNQNADFHPLSTRYRMGGRILFYISSSPLKKKIERQNLSDQIFIHHWHSNFSLFWYKTHKFSYCDLGFFSPLHGPDYFPPTNNARKFLFFLLPKLKSDFFFIHGAGQKSFFFIKIRARNFFF